MEILGWVLVGLSILGNVFVIYKNVMGYYLWTVANTGWIIYHITLGLYPGTGLFGVYLGLGIWGIIKWNNQKVNNV